MIQQTLEDTNFDIDATIGTLLQIMDLSSEAVELPVEDSQEVSSPMPKERPPRKGDRKPANKVSILHINLYLHFFIGELLEGGKAQASCIE